MLPGEGPKQGVGVGCTARELWEEVGQDTPFGAIYKEVLIADGKLRNQPRKEHESRRKQRKIQLGMKGKEEPEHTGERGVLGGGEQDPGRDLEVSAGTSSGSRSRSREEDIWVQFLKSPQCLATEKSGGKQTSQAAVGLTMTGEWVVVVKQD